MKIFCWRKCIGKNVSPERKWQKKVFTKRRGYEQNGTSSKFKVQRWAGERKEFFFSNIVREKMVVAKYFLKIFFVMMMCLLSAGENFAQSDPKKAKEIYFGVNIPRLVAKDYELQVALKVKDKMLVGISAGYDLNAGEEWFTDPIHAGDTTNWHAWRGEREGANRNGSRYFYGKGPIIRAWLERAVVKKDTKWKFFAFELLWKGRNYDNYYWNNQYVTFLESAQQNIFGLTYYTGAYKELNGFLLLKIFGGFGIRYLYSSITRPAYQHPYNTTWEPENKFTYKPFFPTLHLGVAIIFNTQGTGVPSPETK